MHTGDYHLATEWRLEITNSGRTPLRARGDGVVTRGGVLCVMLPLSILLREAVTSSRANRPGSWFQRGAVLLTAWWVDAQIA
jgi:hypothetical protein